MLLFALSLAHAQDFSAGGAVSSGVLYNGEVGLAATQVELNLLYSKDSTIVRVDADAYLDFSEGAEALGLKGRIPLEQAYVGFGDDLGLDIGMIVPAINLESWDPWENQLPEYGIPWTNGYGHIVAVQPRKAVGDGTVFLNGGYDTDYKAPFGSFGYTVANDAWETYSGVTVHQGSDFKMYRLGSGDVFYINDGLKLAADIGAGTAAVGEGADLTPFASAQLQVIPVPDAKVSPAIRVQGSWEKAALWGTAPFAAGVGAKTQPTPWLIVQAEAGASFGDEISPTATLLVTGLTPKE